MNIFAPRSEKIGLRKSMTYSMFEPKGILNAIDEAGLDIIEETPIREPKQSLG
jgi:hypothetical protein